MADTNSSYNETDGRDTFYWSELSTTLAVYGFTFVLGLSGNILMVYTTCRYRRMHNVTNVFLASLAIADLLLILVCIPVKIAKLFSFTWTMGKFLCKFVHYIQNVSVFCSVLTLTAISIERYYGIVYPMKAKYLCTISQAKKIIFATWVLAFVLSGPIIHVQVLIEVGEEEKGYVCVKNWENKELWQSYEIYTLVCVLLIPVSIMTFTYAMICCEVWRVMEKRVLMTGGTSRCENEKHTDGLQYLTNNGEGMWKVKKNKTDTKTTKQVIYMLVAIVFLFAISWTPVLIYDLLTAYGVLDKYKLGIYRYIYTTFHLMAYVNSCINPIVYGFMSKNFRESFQSALCCVGRNKEQRTSSRVTTSITRSRSSSQTRPTTTKSSYLRTSVV